MVKKPPANARDVAAIPGLGRSSEEGNATHSSILAGKSHRRRSLVDYSPWGHKELDATEQLTLHTPHALNLLVILSEEL